MTPAGDGYDEDERRDLAAAALRSGRVLFAVIGIALAAFFAGLACSSTTGSPCADCVNLSGAGPHYAEIALADSPYTCRAEISDNTYRNGEPAAASIEVIVFERVVLVSRPHWSHRNTAVVISETAAAAASGEVIVDAREGLELAQRLDDLGMRRAEAIQRGYVSASNGEVTVNASVEVEWSAVWSLECEPDAVP